MNVKKTRCPLRATALSLAVAIFALVANGCAAAGAARPRSAPMGPVATIDNGNLAADPLMGIDRSALRREPAADAVRVPPPPDGLSTSLRPSWQALFEGDPSRALGLLADSEPSGRRSPEAVTLAGFLANAAGDAAGARRRFEQAVALAPEFAPALYGRAISAEAGGDPQEAMWWLRRAAFVDPEMTEAVVALHIAQLERARELLRDIDKRDHGNGSRNGNGDGGDDVLDDYRLVIQIAPHLLPPYFELASAYRQRGDIAGALAVLEQAQRHVGDVPVVLARLSALYLESGEHARAVDCLERLAALQPRDLGVERRLAAARDKHEIATLPESFRDVEGATVIYREQLAALLAVRLPELSELPSGTRSLIINDIAERWSEPHIRKVAEIGVMETFPNHMFAPEIPVTRAMLADTAYRLLQLVDPGRVSTRARVSDVPSGHLAYPAILAAVALGVMDVDELDRFFPNRKVDGEQAGRAIRRLREIVRESLGKPIY